MSILYRIKVRAIIRNCGFETMQVLVGKPKNINSKWIEVGGLGQSCPDNRPKYTNYYIWDLRHSLIILQLAVMVRINAIVTNRIIYDDIIIQQEIQKRVQGNNLVDDDEYMYIYIHPFKWMAHTHTL